MESLRPDRDELDRFKSRNNENKKDPKPKSAGQSSNASSSSTPPVAVVAAKTPVWVMMLLVVLLVGSGGMVWMFLEQQTQIATLQENLDRASGTIDQGQLLMARFEGELSNTGSELEQSGSVAEKKLAFLDSEMRKLWAVANDRNKKSIQKNSDLIAVSESKIEKHSSVQSDLKGLQKGLSQSLVGIEKQASKLDGRISTLANEVSITRAEQEEELGGIKSSIQKTLEFGGQAQSLVEKLSSRLKESESSIVSINASRRQINERLVELERQLSEIQLKIKGSKP